MTSTVKGLVEIVYRKRMKGQRIAMAMGRKQYKIVFRGKQLKEGLGMAAQGGKNKK